MKFKDLPVVFLSYQEANADENFEHLKRMVPNAIRVHGVKGFDSAHKAASAAAKKRAAEDFLFSPFFITVDGDNRTFRKFWELDTDNIRELYKDKISDGLAFSWNAYNPGTGLSYGNGGLKLWTYSFVDRMVTHESTPDTVVDFCWLPGYHQFAEIFSVTDVYGSPLQAFTAGFREGAKMPLVAGTTNFRKLSAYKSHAYDSNIRRLECWMNLGAHLYNGEWSSIGAIKGFYAVHLSQKLPLAKVSDYSTIAEWFSQDDVSDLRKMIHEQTGIKAVQLGPRQSAFVINLLLPIRHNGSPYDTYTNGSHRFNPMEEI